MGKINKKSYNKNEENENDSAPESEVEENHSEKDQKADESSASDDEPLSGNKKSKKSKKSPAKSNGKKAKSKKNADGSESEAEGEENDEVEYEVKEIIDHKIKGGKSFYLVRWKGFTKDDDTWEPKESLSCKDLIDSYEKKKQAEQDDSEDGESITESEANKKRKSNDDDHSSSSKKPKKSSKKLPAKLNEKKTKSKNSDDEDDGSGEEEYEVKDIIDHKMEGGRSLYLVRWKGFTKDDDTWEPKESLSCKELIEKFEKKKAESSNGKSKKKTDKKSSKAKGKKELPTDPSKEWEVDKIIDYAEERGVTYYRIRWKGFKANKDTWEPRDNLFCDDLIDKFEKRMKSMENVTFKELREEPKKTKRLVNETALRTDITNKIGRSSKRSANKKRVYYGDSDD